MLSMKLGRSIPWDGEKEPIPGDETANQLLRRDYRKGWEYPAARTPVSMTSCVGLAGGGLVIPL